MSFSWSRWVGIIVKEFIQLKRDRLTFGMIIGIPVIQLILFGYAINADPKRLPTAVLSADSSPYSRTLLAGQACLGHGYHRNATAARSGTRRREAGPAESYPHEGLGRP